MKPLKFFALFLALFPFFSCTTSINGVITENGSTKLDIDTALKPRITALVRTLAAAGGQQDALILDGPAIAKSISDASFKDADAVFKNTSPSAIEGRINIFNINRLFLAAKGAEKFVIFEQGKNGGKCVFIIDLESGSVLLNSTSPEIAAYLNVLMAPIATGEEMTKAEYLALVSSIFSKAVSDEIASSKINISIGFPGQVTSATGGTIKGKTAVYEIPLLDILVLETPLTYEVNWK